MMMMMMKWLRVYHMIKYFYLIDRWNINRYHYYGSELPGSNINEVVFHISQNFSPGVEPQMKFNIISGHSLRTG